MGEKVMVGISGGVDSGAAALLLRKEGYEVEGVTLLLRPEDDERDLHDARTVAQAVGIRHHVLDLRRYFADTVIRDFTRVYTQGRTPNPCVVCNPLIKFGKMMEFARENGCVHLATGHYAAVRFDPARGRWLLEKSPSRKDQSYFLYRLGQAQLAHALFPLASLEKTQVRALAEEAGLPVAKKSDSQEICFLPDGGYAEFIERTEGYRAEPGNFVDAAGKVIGRHNGLIRYTVGQRKGLGATFGKPMYVVRLDVAGNNVVLGEEGSQYAAGLRADQVNWIAMESPNEPFRAQVKIRCQAKPADAWVYPGEMSFSVRFDEPQRAVTPGQSAVLYTESTVLGGGTILDTERE